MTDPQKPGLHRIHNINWWHMLLRFLFGAGISAIAGVVALTFGPRPAGPLLAFPSILPAALTFLQEKSGKDASLSNLYGASLGAVGLTAFAVIVSVTATHAAGVVAIGLAMLVWIVISVSLWALLHELKPWRKADRKDQRSEVTRQRVQGSAAS